MLIFNILPFEMTCVPIPIAWRENQVCLFFSPIPYIIWKLFARAASPKATRVASPSRSVQRSFYGQQVTPRIIHRLNLEFSAALLNNQVTLPRPYPPSAKKKRERREEKKTDATFSPFFLSSPPIYQSRSIGCAHAAGVEKHGDEK